MSPQIVASAPGKIILSGEHTVVYGYPALVAAVDRRIRIELTAKSGSLKVQPESSAVFVKSALQKLKEYIKIPVSDLNISLQSDIPIGRGMGSSAAFAVGFTAALSVFLGKKADLRSVSDLAYELEKVYHGNPSGVDISISVNGGILWFRKETENFKTFSPVRIKSNIPDIYIYDTGKPEETTKETVARVAEIHNKKPSATLKVFKEIEQTSRSFLQFFTADKSYDLGELITANEKLLEKLGVVSGSTVELIRKIEKAGGAAKMSGGGGIRGASGIILIYHPDKEKLFSFAKNEDIKLEKVKLGVKGVKIEKNG